MIIYNGNENLKPIRVAERTGFIDIVKHKALVYWSEEDGATYLTSSGIKLVEQGLESFWQEYVEPFKSLEKKNDNY